jgi:hypothetical protein
MTEITILTGTNRFVLDEDAATALLAHIRSAGGANQGVAEAPLLTAIDGNGAEEVRWSDEGKHGALHAINAWLISEGTTSMPDVMPEIRDELMRDLRLPPFDEEIPYDTR